MKIIVAKTRTYCDSISVSKQFIIPVDIREGTDSEVKYINEIIDTHIDVFTKKHKRKGLVPKPDKEIADYIKDNLYLLYVDNEYLIGFSVVSPWFSTTEFVSEEFVLRINRGASSLTNATNALMQVAKNLGADYVAVGTLAADNIHRHEGLAILYEKAGFTRQEYTLWRKT